jgi:hypothetical protein
MTQNVALCDPFFWENPRVLVGSAWLRRWTENFDSRCASDITNEVAAVYSFFFLVGCLLAIGLNYPYALPICLAIASVYLGPAMWALYYLPNCKEPKTTEGFTATETVAGVLEQNDTENPGNYETGPTYRNPFMNVLVDELKYNPNRPSARSIQAPDVQDSLDAFFRVQWTSDPTDIYGKTQSQREFVTMPSTSVPNDQGSFADWLYRIPGKTCKEGGREACLPGTDGGPVTWLNVNR